MHCTKSVNFTAFGKSLTCTLGPFHHVCFSKAAAFVPSSHKARDQRRCAACFGFRTEQQRLVFTKVNMGSVYIYIFFLQHLLFSTLIFKASYFELNAIFCILQSWLVFGDQRAAESNCQYVCLIIGFWQDIGFICSLFNTFNVGYIYVLPQKSIFVLAVAGV